MDLHDFYNGMETISTWFGKKLTEPQQDIVFGAINFIPNKAWNDIIEKYTKTTKPLPSHFPTSQDIVSQWYIWRNEHPELCEKEFIPTPCGKCFSRGMLWFKEFHHPLGRNYEHIVRCSSCDNWKQHFNHQTKVPRRSREDLEQDPKVIEVWPYER